MSKYNQKMVSAQSFFPITGSSDLELESTERYGLWGLFAGRSDVEGAAKNTVFLMVPIVLYFFLWLEF